MSRPRARCRPGAWVQGAAHDWERGLVALRRYIAARGSVLVSSNTMAAGVALGAWVAHQHEQYWSGTLNPQRATLLESLPGWSWNGRHQRRWHQRLAALTQYARTHGTAVVGGEVVVNALHVGAWAAAQRAAHAAGTLPARNAALLEELPGWHWSAEDRWERGLQAVRRYVADHGTADPPADTQVDGFPLGRWIHRCREDHRARSLSPERIEALASLPGWRWAGADERWEQGIRALRAYVDAHGTANLPQGLAVGGFALGDWVHSRRRQYRTGTLPPDRAAVLEALPGWRWSVQHNEAWQHGLVVLRGYAATRGTASLTGSTVVEDFALGEWARTQRAQYRRGCLAARRVEQLEAIPGWSWRAAAEDLA